MKACLISLTILMLTGCGNQNNPAPEQPERDKKGPETQKVSVESQPSETNDSDDAYARGVVTLTTGKKVSGNILWECAGYLTVCSDTNSSEAIPHEDIQSVTFAKARRDLPEFWMKLPKSITILTTEQSPGGAVLKAAPQE